MEETEFFTEVGTDTNQKKEISWNAQFFRLMWSKPRTFYEDEELTARRSNRGDYLQVRCLMCKTTAPSLGPDKSHHCRIFLSINKFKCIRCGSKGTLDYFVNFMPSEGVQLDDKGDLGKFIKRSPSSYDTTSSQSPGITVSILTLDRSHIAWQYLFSEGFSEQQLVDIAKTKGIFYCVKGREFTKYKTNTTQDRLIFPIKEEGKRIGWQARYMSPLPKNAEDSKKEKEVMKLLKIQKYLLSPGFKRKHHPYNVDCLNNYDTIIAVEGVKKVWKTGPFSIGTFGISIELDPRDDNWVNLLLSKHKKLILLFDKGTEELAENIIDYYIANGGIGEAISLPEDGPDDLDDYSSIEIHKILKENATLELPF